VQVDKKRNNLVEREGERRNLMQVKKRGAALDR
jgi:hypothetical protein